MPIVHSFDPPERFVAGTVGQPGERQFFLQARDSQRLTTISLEKQQVATLAERVEELLDEVLAAGAASGVIPAVAPFALDDAAPLDSPISEDFRAGTMTLSWDPHDERVVIEVYPWSEEAVVSPDQVGEDLAEPEPDELLVVRLDPAVARAFVKRSLAIVNAGRPDCPFCGRPVDADGHLCVRANGFRRREP